MSGAARVEVVNNLFVGPLPLATNQPPASGASFSHNLFFAAGGNPALPRTVLESPGHLSADPRLPEAWPALAPWPLPGSPAVDAGAELPLELAGDTDFTGRPRRQGAAPDIGAYESDGVARPGPEPLRLHVRPDGNDAAAGTSWGTALKTLGAAVTRDAFSRPLEIMMAGGSYREAVRVPPFVRLSGGYAGTEPDGERPAPGAAPTVLEDSESGTVLDVSVTGDSVTLEGLRFAGDGAVRLGSVALLGIGADTTVRDCEFIGFRRTASGGRAALFRGAPRFERCVFRGNACGDGGALEIDTTAGEALVTGCLFETNAPGWAMSRTAGLMARGHVEVANSVFRGHVAGGSPLAVVTIVGYDGLAPRLRHCTVVGNRSASGAQTLAGVAFRDLGNARPDMRDCLVVSNDVGVRLSGSSGPGITNNVFFGNPRAGDGPFVPGPPFNLTFDPLLAPDGFRLLPGSPARDLGGPAGGVDFDGQPRWQGASSDLGAVELPPAAAEHAALARLDWRVVTVGDLAYLRYAGVLSNSCAVSFAGTVSNGVVHVTPLVPPGSPPCDEPAVLNGLLPLGGWRPELAALPVALDGQVATGVVTPPPPGPLPPALRLLAGTRNLRATVLGLPGLTYTLERTEDFVRWEPVAELHDTAPAGDPDEPVSLEHSLPPAGTNGVLRLRM